MRTSKYLNKTFGNWTCTYVGIASVRGAKTKRPGHRDYYYIMERRTSDGLCDKMVRLNSTEVVQVNRGIKLIEDIVDKRKKNAKFTRKVSYHFI